MSHFIVGRIEAGSDATSALVAQRVSRLGETEGLTVRLIVRASTRLQSEILGAAGLYDGPGAIFFDVVGASGTADELISPYVCLNQWPQLVKATAEAISRFGSQLLAENSVHEVAIVFSEGYDTNYDVCEVSVDSMVSFLMERFSKAGQVPSLVIVAKR